MDEHQRLNAALAALQLSEDATVVLATFAKVALTVRHLNTIAQLGVDRKSDASLNEIAKYAIESLAYLAHKTGHVTPAQFMDIANAAAQDLDDVLLQGVRLFNADAVGGVQ